MRLSRVVVALRGEAGTDTGRRVCFPYSYGAELSSLGSFAFVTLALSYMAEDSQ